VQSLSTAMWRDINRPAGPLGVTLKGIPGMTSVTRLLHGDELPPRSPADCAEELAQCAHATQPSSTAAPTAELQAYMVRSGTWFTLL